jgi:GNAT superfamily N-acetyltransferase
MVLVRKAVPADWETLRDIRLAALRDAPDAFGSTYPEQAAFTRERWLDRIAGNGTFLAYLDKGEPVGDEVARVGDPGEPVGLAGGYQEESGVIELVSMWVRPRARGHGVGEALLDAVADWARTTHNASALHLWVTETNKPARLLYERNGFTATGERQPVPSNPALTEIAMSRPL